MKKFIVKLALLLTMISLALFAISEYYTYCDKSDKDNTDKFNKIQDNIQISNIGSSHGQFAFCYDEISEYKCFNFALPSQSLSYDYRILQEYSKYLAENGIMFIPISYFSFYYDEVGKDPDFESKNIRYYKILSPIEIKRFSLKDFIIIRYFPILYPNNDLSIMLHNKTKNTFYDTWNRTANEINVNEDAIAAYDRHVTLYSDNGKMIDNQEEIDSLYKIINLCKKKSITPILITTPFLNEYTDLSTKDFLNQFYSKINQVKDYTGVLYYDYSRDERFATDYTLFMNSDHLNQTGAKKFVSILYNEIIKNLE